MARILTGLVILAVLALGTLLAASELGGEVVVLRSYDGDGRAFETSLWVVDDGDSAWLRGGAESSWVRRVEANPRVELIRGGETGRYQAEIVPSQRERVDRLMAERYGVADHIVSVIRDEQNRIVVLLEPLD